MDTRASERIYPYLGVCTQVEQNTALTWTYGKYPRMSG